jgi:hypothetical protein
MFAYASCLNRRAPVQRGTDMKRTLLALVTTVVLSAPCFGGEREIAAPLTGVVEADGGVVSNGTESDLVARETFKG